MDACIGIKNDYEKRRIKFQIFVVQFEYQLLIVLFLVINYWMLFCAVKMQNVIYDFKLWRWLSCRFKTYWWLGCSCYFFSSEKETKRVGRNLGISAEEASRNQVHAKKLRCRTASKIFFYYYNNFLFGKDETLGKWETTFIIMV